MSEPTYRVELRPNTNPEWPWAADIYRIADDKHLTSKVGETREDAFDKAQEVVRAIANRLTEPHTNVFLSEDGDIIDPHEVQR